MARLIRILRRTRPHARLFLCPPCPQTCIPGEVESSAAGGHHVGQWQAWISRWCRPSGWNLKVEAACSSKNWARAPSSFESIVLLEECRQVARDLLDPETVVRSSGPPGRALSSDCSPRQSKTGRSVAGRGGDVHLVPRYRTRCLEPPRRNTSLLRLETKELGGYPTMVPSEEKTR